MRRIFSVAAAAVFLAFGIQVLPAQAVPAAKPYGPGVNLLGSVEPSISRDDGGNASGTLGGHLFFAGTGGSGVGTELWVTDGTAAGTRMFKDLFPGDDDSYPSNFVRLGSRLYFTATNATGNEWWVTDGTFAGTKQFRDIRTGPLSSAPGPALLVGGRFYFAAKTQEFGRELWVSDGTAGGTRQVADLRSGVTDSFPHELTAFGTKVVFSAYLGTEVLKPFVTAGTPETTFRLDSEPAGTTVSSGDYEVLGSKVLFRGRTPSTGYELWSTAGRQGDARPVKDLYPGTINSYPSELTRIGDSVVFSAYDDDLGNELWTSDGTAGGTVVLRDIFFGVDDSEPSSLVRVGGDVYFNARDSENNYELWATRGTTATTRKVTEAVPGVEGADPYVAAAVGGRLLLSARTPTTGYEPWVSNGTAAGTRPLGDFNAGLGSSYPGPLGVLGGTVLFELRTTDGLERLAAYTLPVPRLTASPKKSYSRRDAARKKIRIKVAVAATGVVPTGRVALYKGSQRVGSATLSRGTAKIRITSKLRRGKHTLVVRYGGSLWAQSNSSVPFRIRVR